MLSTSLKYAPWSALLLLVSQLSSSVSAAPLEVQKRAISSDIFNNLEFFAQYSGAAYCPSNNDSPGSEIQCDEGNCPLIEAADTETLTEFENSIKTDVTGFVALDNTNKLIVISFRGSRSVRNWITNLVFPTTETTICADCKASTGFWKSWLEAEDGVRTAVTAAQAAHPDYKVVATGHSLGGALATLAAGALRANGTNVDLYTYGSPKVGNGEFANFLSDTSKGASYRVTHRDDPVPRLPPFLLGFRHVSPEYYIDSGVEEYPTLDNIEVYDGTLNFGGSEGNIAIQVDAHRFYFGRTSACEREEGIEIKRDEEAVRQALEAR